MCVYGTYLSTHLSTSCFHLLATVNNATTNTGVLVSIQISSLYYYVNFINITLVMWERRPKRVYLYLLQFVMSDSMLHTGIFYLNLSNIIY